MDRIRQIDVLVVIGSLNITDDSMENTIVPIPNPISLDGHISPLKAKTIFLTEYIKSIEAGMPIKTTNQ